MSKTSNYSTLKLALKDTVPRNGGFPVTFNGNNPSSLERAKFRFQIVCDAVWNRGFYSRNEQTYFLLRHSSYNSSAVNDTV
jgi:hypothetical protein